MRFLFRPQNAGRSLLGGVGIPAKRVAKEIASDVEINKTYWETQSTNLAEWEN